MSQFLNPVDGAPFFQGELVVSLFRQQQRRKDSEK
jgi:hypothetical protein